MFWRHGDTIVSVDEFSFADLSPCAPWPRNLCWTELTKVSSLPAKRSRSLPPFLLFSFSLSFSWSSSSSLSFSPCCSSLLDRRLSQTDLLHLRPVAAVVPRLLPPYRGLPRAFRSTLDNQQLLPSFISSNFHSHACLHRTQGCTGTAVPVWPE